MAEASRSAWMSWRPPASEPEISFWSCREDDERLEHESPDDALYYWLDETDLEDWPLQKTVYAFARMQRSAGELESLAEWLLENAIERLDEEYGSPDDAPDETEAMRAAARAFVATIDRELEVWAHEHVRRADVTINVPRWVRENEPKWLEDPVILDRVQRLETEERADNEEDGSVDSDEDEVLP